jgi:hypothetical protein
MDTTALEKLETKVDAIGQQIGVMAVQMAQQSAESMRRSEIEAADNRRVLAETYLADQHAVAERLGRLEGSPVRQLSYIGAGVGCFATLISMSGLLFGIISWLALHYR